VVRAMELAEEDLEKVKSVVDDSEVTNSAEIFDDVVRKLLPLSLVVVLVGRNKLKSSRGIDDSVVAVLTVEEVDM
jgi:hypothetical protein